MSQYQGLSIEGCCKIGHDFGPAVLVNSDEERNEKTRNTGPLQTAVCISQQHPQWLRSLCRDVIPPRPHCDDNYFGPTSLVKEKNCHQRKHVPRERDLVGLSFSTVVFCAIAFDFFLTIYQHFSEDQWVNEGHLDVILMFVRISMFVAICLHEQLKSQSPRPPAMSTKWIVLVISLAVELPEKLLFLVNVSSKELAKTANRSFSEASWRWWRLLPICDFSLQDHHQHRNCHGLSNKMVLWLYQNSFQYYPCCKDILSHKTALCFRAHWFCVSKLWQHVKS